MQKRNITQLGSQQVYGPQLGSQQVYSPQFGSQQYMYSPQKMHSPGV